MNSPNRDGTAFREHESLKTPKKKSSSESGLLSLAVEAY
jgi:hypothetical protein